MNRTVGLSTGFLALLLVTGGAGVTACHAGEPTSPTAGLTKPVDPPTMPDLGRGASRTEVDVHYSIFIGDPLVHSCSGPAPFFDFDSASTDDKDQPTMQMLTNCMKDGPLKGKSIQLVGHTDPRGTEKYNDKLGLERAERVKHYLVTHGIAENRVQARTAGEDDARSSPKDWPTDRRVEIKLAP